jgi:60 kDa SS-A/Ro ribonucleoprotein
MLKNFLNRITNTTHEGGKAYELTPDEKLLRLFTIGQLNGSFYLDTDTVVREAAETLEAALQERPEFASRCAVYAAEELGMKAIPTLWTVYLSTLPDKTLFRQVFPRVITNPKLAHDFLTLARKGGIRQGLGQGVKRVVNSWLEQNLNPVWATRYAGKLEDLVRVTRPKDTPGTVDYLQYILRPAIMENGRFQGYGPRRLTFPRAQALAEVLADLEAGRVSDRTLALIREQKLQLEELKHAFGTLTAAARQAVFAELIPGLWYAALVTNLVAIERAFAAETQTVQAYRAGQRYQQEVVLRQEVPADLVRTVAERLRDKEAYRRSKMLPFGLIAASGMTTVPEWRGAISEVLSDLGADAGLGELPVRMLIGADMSGSMDTELTRSLSARTAASVYASMAAMAARSARVYAVSNEAREVGIDRGARLLDNARRIVERIPHGGTQLAELLRAYRGEEVVLLITDEQTADRLEDQWVALANRSRGARLIIWDIVHYQNKVAKRSDVFYVSGWGDRVLQVIGTLITGTDSQMAAVKRIVL